jgi:hypothetical protein
MNRNDGTLAIGYVIGQQTPKYGPSGIPARKSWTVAGNVERSRRRIIERKCTPSKQPAVFALHGRVT